MGIGRKEAGESWEGVIRARRRMICVVKRGNTLIDFSAVGICRSERRRMECERDFGWEKGFKKLSHNEEVLLR